MRVHGAHKVRNGLASSRRIFHGERPGLEGKTDTLARGREWLTHTTMAALPVKEALDGGTLAGERARQCLALAIAGMFCVLASVAGSAWQAIVDSGEARWPDQVPGAEMKPNTD